MNDPLSRTLRTILSNQRYHVPGRSLRWLRNVWAQTYNPYRTTALHEIEYRNHAWEGTRSRDGTRGRNGTHRRDGTGVGEKIQGINIFKKRSHPVPSHAWLRYVICKPVSTPSHKLVAMASISQKQTVDNQVLVGRFVRCLCFEVRLVDRRPCDTTSWTAPRPAPVRCYKPVRKAHTAVYLPECTVRSVSFAEGRWGIPKSCSFVLLGTTFATSGRFGLHLRHLQSCSTPCKRRRVWLKRAGKILSGSREGTLGCCL